MLLTVLRAQSLLVGSSQPVCRMSADLGSVLILRGKWAFTISKFKKSELLNTYLRLEIYILLQNYFYYKYELLLPGYGSKNCPVDLH